MLASIIIITKNQKAFLQKTIPTLLKQNINGSFEIIAVDSGSTDGAREYLKKMKIILIIIPSKHFNYASAFNKGAQKAKGKYLIRLSGDCIPVGKTWLRELIEPFSDDKIGGVFGKYIITGKKGYGYPDHWPKSRFPEKLTTYSVKQLPFLGVLGVGGVRVYELPGGCSAIRKSIWVKRSFNENLIDGEDAEYAWFLHLIGYDIVCNPKAEVIHEHKINRIKTIKIYLAINKSFWVFNWEIMKYWIGRFQGKDPYENIRFKE